MSDVPEKTRKEKIKDFIRYLRFSRTGKITLWYLFFIFLVNGGIVVFDAIFAHKFALWNLINLIIFGFGYPYFFTYRLMYRKQMVNAAKMAMEGQRWINEWGEFDKKAHDAYIKEMIEQSNKSIAALQTALQQAQVSASQQTKATITATLKQLSSTFQKKVK
jgi:hypothetical protein